VARTTDFCEDLIDMHEDDSGSTEYVTYRRVSSDASDDEKHDAAAFREFLYPHDDHRLADFRGMSAREYAAFRFRVVEMLRDAVARWQEKLDTPFVGVTTDGSVVPGLYQRGNLPDEFAAPTEAMVQAAQKVLDALNEDQIANYIYPIDATEWRK
jgi:hypothetical protein